MTKSTNPIITDPNDPNYDPNKDPLFDPPPSGMVADGQPQINDGYAGTGKTAAELVALYGTNPDGSPRTEAAPTGPSCPPVSLSDGPFDTETIPPGCSAPLTAECAAYYNDQIAAAQAGK